MLCKRIIFESGNFHYVSGTKYSKDNIISTTFCSKEIEICCEDEYIKIPLDLLNDSEICESCQVRIELIKDSKFPSSYTGEHRFIIRATINTNETIGDIEIQVISADNIKQAKRRFENIFDCADEIIYYTILKEVDNLNTVKLYERENKP